MEAQNNKDEAIKLYQQVVQERPKDLTSSLKLLSLLSELKKNAEALAFVEKCLKFFSIVYCFFLFPFFDLARSVSIRPRTQLLTV